MELKDIQKSEIVLFAMQKPPKHKGQGDYSVHAQAILIAGYPSDDIPMEWLHNGLKEK